jgi:integrase
VKGIKTDHKSLVGLAKEGLHRVDRGLYLKVGTEGGKSWVFRYRVGGRLRGMGLGSFPETKLTEARDKLTSARKLLSLAVDPIEERRDRRAKLAAKSSEITFKQAAEECIGARASGWRNGKHSTQWTNTLDTYAYPFIGKMPAGKVTRSDVLAVLNPIWSSKPETASRVRQRVESVLSYWAAKNHVTGYDNPARWRAGLDSILPKPTKVRKVEHHAALPYTGMYEFMTKLRAREGSEARALEFAILTATRTTETRLAQWSEIDLKAATWTVPGSRMKHGRDFEIPLSKRAVEILKGQHGLDGQWVFPGTKAGSPINQNALLNTIKDLGYDVTAHGFRSTIRDWIAETTNAGHEVAEMVLGHAIGDKTEAAYRRGDLLQKRAALMEKWAAYCAKKPASVTAIHGQKGDTHG